VSVQGSQSILNDPLKSSPREQADSLEELVSREQPRLDVCKVRSGGRETRGVILGFFVVRTASRSKGVREA